MHMKRFLSAALALMMMFSMTMLSAGAADVKTPFETLVPDANFRAAIQAAKDMPENLNGMAEAELIAALEAFHGEIKASNKGIKLVDGIEYLKEAEFINLKNNLIEDWRGVYRGDAYYGYTDDIGKKHDVRLSIGGNPFRFLPANFGGWLVVDQAATTSSPYPEDMYTPRVFVRNDETDELTGTFDIRRCKIGDTGAYVNVLSVAPANRNNEENYLSITNYTNTSANFKATKTGEQIIAVGIDQDIHYHTTDGFGTITDGSQSFKYYISPFSYVYDRVKLTYAGTGGVVLTKTDEDTGAVLAGAVYELYHGDTLIGTYTTDEDGTIEVTNLNTGDYYFKETHAPAGYILDTEKTIPFSIGAELGGGLKTVTPTADEIKTKPDGTPDNPVKPLEPITAGSHEVFIAGPSAPDENGENDPSPNITLAQLGGDTPSKVTVKYSKLSGSTDAPQSADFTTLALAADDVNEKKNANLILGPVEIMVSFDSMPIHEVQVFDTNKKTPPPPSPSIPTTSVKGQKVWEDDNNAGDTRPTSIKVELYRDNGDTPLRTATVTAAKDWKYSFTGLTKYRTGNTLYTYTVKEANVPEGYTCVVSDDNKTITNTLTPPEEPPVTPEEPIEPSDPGETPPVDPNTPSEPENPAETPPVDPDEPSTTPPATPDEPPVAPPEEVPPASPNLPQTGSVYRAAKAGEAMLILLVGITTLSIAYLWRKRRDSQ